jgi:ParB family chromosome partitioning protein
MSQVTTIQQLDPRTLIIDVDVRAEAWPDRALVASIRNTQVLPPVKALHSPDGGIRVRYGHRRILAAIEAGRETVPVLVTEAEDDQAAGIVAHMTDNLDQSPRPVRDKIASVGQLNMLGMSAAQITRRTKSDRKDVDAAILAASSKVAVEAVQRYEFLTLDQAAAVAEFENNRLAVQTLIITAQREPAQFDEVLECQRRIRARLDQARANRERVDVAKMTRFVLADRLWNTQRAAYVENYYNNEAGAAHNKRASTETHGHRVIGGGSAWGPMTAEKAKRAEIAANNKAWRSAETSRREWLSVLLARKTPPAGAAVFVSAMLSRVALDRGRCLAAQILGIGNLGMAHDVTDARAQVITLAQVIAALEFDTGVHSWRRGSELTAGYLTWLAQHGYTLSPVEELCLTRLQAV